MHVPDGFLSPQTYLSLYAINLPIWIYSIKRFSKSVRPDELPRLALSSGFVFILTSIQFPIIGGTTVHLLGIVITTLLFGVIKTYLIYTVVFLLQATLLGMGGVTSLPLNTFAMGFLGPLSVYFLDKTLKNILPQTFLIILLNFVSIFLVVLFTSFVLGIQPDIAKGKDGNPLYFPFRFPVVFSAMLISHLPIMVLESVVSNLFMKFAKKLEFYQK
ncbi:MAG: energy-coupling factor ABC transporter permease [Leptospiraceae bacterium]|nr:energy-coupling factor ABC transporter permease [Leptospiraceae bacterium]MDW7975998.1 energy-coupling factor ABC transporter permease [Leptospiraceae bacterium]